MSMKKGLLIMFLAALVAVAPCWACQLNANPPCYQQRVYYQNYPQVVVKKEIVEKQVLVASLVPLVVTVPTYSATYVAGYQQAQVNPAQAVAQGYAQQPQGQSFDVNALNQVLTAINTRLTTIESSIQGGVSSSSQQATFANDATRLFAAKCASCHGDAPRGNSFTMFSGNQMVKLTDRQVGKMLSRISRAPNDPKIMPPPDSGIKLSDQEMSLAAAYCDAMLAAGDGSQQPTSGQMSVPNGPPKGPLSGPPAPTQPPNGGPK